MRELRSAVRERRQPIVPIQPHAPSPGIDELHAPTKKQRKGTGIRKKRNGIVHDDVVVVKETTLRRRSGEEKMDNEYESCGGSGNKGGAAGAEDETNTPPLPQRVYDEYFNNSS